VLGGWGTVELWPPPQPLSEPPPPAEDAGWISWLRENTPEDAVLCCLPPVKGRQVEDYLETTLWMYAGCRHGRRLVNGYSGFFPNDFLRLKEALNKSTATKSLDALVGAGVTYVVVSHPDVFAQWLMTRPGPRSRLKRKMLDERAGVAVYQLLR
jgi:hypothetical protein